MDAWFKVVLGTIVFAAGTILLLFVGALLFARSIQRKTHDMGVIHKQLVELSKQHQDAASRWLRRRMLLSFVTIALIILALLNRQWYLFLAILIMLPLGLILHGLEIMNLKYVLVSLPLRPLRLLTGDVAMRYGKIMLVAGLVLLVLCILLAISASVFPIPTR